MTRMNRSTREHLLALAGFALLAVGASWPLVRDFSTRPLADVSYDQQHALWMLWHVKEALLGHEPWFTTKALFYPHGISTLIDGVAPLNGLLALPFWPWGAVAAYNGAILAGLALTGWCMYLLARYGFAATPSVAFFAGVVYLLWPIHLAGLWGHLEKVFIGALPLCILAVLKAWNPARPAAWVFAPGGALLVALLQHGDQFLFAAMAFLFLAIWLFVASAREARRAFVDRVVLSAAAGLLILGPLLFQIVRAARDPELQTAASGMSIYYSPDVLQFVLPSIHQAVLGRILYPDYDTIGPEYTRRARLGRLNPNPHWLGSGIETAATIPMIVLLLGFGACIRRAPGSLLWLVFSAIFLLFALGPLLRLAGRTTFTIYGLPVMLPYAFLTSYPPFNVLRTPARFLMIAGVGLTILAVLGLMMIVRRFPRFGAVIAGAATAVALIECWPNPWPQQVPPPLPSFYQTIARDSQTYAVLDLPPGGDSSYMYYQTFHRKPIAWGYLSRGFLKYPVAEVANALAADLSRSSALKARNDLARIGYRYLVWHKHGELFSLRRPETVRNGPFQGPPGDPQSVPFIRLAFAGEKPLVDDALVTVYTIPGGERASGPRSPDVSDLRPLDAPAVAAVHRACECMFSSSLSSRRFPH